jgi:PST family polysaccharide transporter
LVPGHQPGRNLGGNITGFNLFNFFARNLDNILIGKVAGEAQLGLYDRAYKLLLLPLSQITSPIAKVAVPLMARTQHDAALYKKSYLKMLEVILLLTYPGTVVALVASHMLVVTMLGEQWAGAAPIFQILAVGPFFAPISNSTSWLFMTQNRTREMRNYGLASSIAFVLSFIIGLPWGVVGVAACYIGAGVIQGPLIWFAATRKGQVSFGDLVKALSPYVVALAITIPLIWLISLRLPASIISLAAMLVMAYAAFTLAMLLTRRGRTALADVISQVRNLAALRRPS